jgi:hypothetical protein
VPIDEEQAEPAAALERERRAQQNRAVAAETQRILTSIQHVSDRIGKPWTPLAFAVIDCFSA